MSLAQHVVVRVVGGCHLQASRTELNVYVAVLDDGDDASYERHYHLLALEPLVLRVLGVYAHGGIAHDGFRACCCHNGIVALLVLVDDVSLAGVLYVRAVALGGDIVFQVVELRLLVHVYNLLVAECRLSLRVPVDHAETAVYKSFVVQVYEYLDNALRACLVHGKCRAVPVA